MQLRHTQPSTVFAFVKSRANDSRLLQSEHAHLRLVGCNSVFSCLCRRCWITAARQSCVSLSSSQLYVFSESFVFSCWIAARCKRCGATCYNMMWLFMAQSQRIKTEMASDWCCPIKSFINMLNYFHLHCGNSIKAHSICLWLQISAAVCWCGAALLHPFVELLSSCVAVIGPAVSGRWDATGVECVYHASRSDLSHCCTCENQTGALGDARVLPLPEQTVFDPTLTLPGRKGPARNQPAVLQLGWKPKFSGRSQAELSVINNRQVLRTANAVGPPTPGALRFSSCSEDFKLHPNWC